VKGLKPCNKVDVGETSVAYTKTGQDDFVTTGKLIGGGQCDRGGGVLEVGLL